MATRSRKVRRQRGSRTHGWGQVGQHRRTGSKGGAGMAGLHKHKWSYTVKYAPDHFGHNIFRPPNSKKVTKWLNTSDLSRLPHEDGRMTDLGALGYQKLLGGGRVDGSYNLKIPNASARAIEKIKAAGGTIQVQFARSAGQDEQQSYRKNGKKIKQ